MTPQQNQQLEQRLMTWRTEHPDADSRRAAYRRKVLEFTLHSMALEGELVDREGLCELLNQPAP